MLKSFVMSVCFLVVSKAYGYPPSNPPQTVRIGGPLQVQRAATEIVPLSGPMYIKNLIVQAQGSGSDSTIEVMVNGQVKGTIHAPGADPSYVVTVAEVARSVEFRHRDGGPMQVISVLATVSAGTSSPPRLGGRFNGSRDEIIQIASATLQDLEALAKYATPADEQTYLFPIKRNAGLVYVMATAHGTLSKQTIAQLVALCDQIAFAQPYLDKQMLLDVAFDTVVDLMTIREALLAMLN